MICVVHPTGNTFVRALVEGLSAEERLGVFATSLGFATGCGDGTHPARTPSWMPQSRRYRIPESRFERFPLREVTRLICSRLGMGWPTRHETGWASVDAVYTALDSDVAARLSRWQSKFNLSAVHTYEDGALATLRAASHLGIRRSYELPIAYWSTSRRLLDEEAQRLPDWEPTLGGTRDSESKFQRKTAELMLAEHVICPSQFVADSIPTELKQGRRVTVIPFGSPAMPMPNAIPARQSGRLRILFAGTMTQRKGLGDVFSAMKLLGRKDVELVVLGSLAAPMSFYRAVYSNFIYERPRPHNQALELMRSCDVLVLPSIVEGRALVQQEAMSCGLPVITTANAGAEDLIEDKRTGILVPIRSPEAIASAVNWFAENRRLLLGLRVECHRKAQQLTWGSYVRHIAKEISE